MDKYEEAPLKMRQYVESGIIDAINAESIFPELAESEDERIRREIIDFIQWAEDRGMTRHDYHQAKRPAAWITYLEKQKDSKWSPSEDEMGVLYKLCYISNQVTDEDDTKLTRLYQDLKREYFNGRSFENMFPSEKQKEQKGANGNEKEIPNGQKPAVWSEEDEKMYARVVRRYTDYEWVIMRTKEESVANKMLNAVAQEEIWLKALTERFNLQPKQEWSEEDDMLMDELESYILYDKEFNDKQKSWRIKRLKSLRPRPHWRPSEEQMGLFGRIVNDLKIKMVGVTVKEHHTLESLYDDLKKLM